MGVQSSTTSSPLPLKPPCDSSDAAASVEQPIPTHLFGTSSSFTVSLQPSRCSCLDSLPLTAHPSCSRRQTFPRASSVINPFRRVRVVRSAGYHPHEGQQQQQLTVGPSPPQRGTTKDAIGLSESPRHARLAGWADGRVDVGARAQRVQWMRRKKGRRKRKKKRKSRRRSSSSSSSSHSLAPSVRELRGAPERRSF